MKNLSVSTKLFLGFGVVLLLLIASLAVSAVGMQRISGETRTYADYTVPNAQYLSDMRMAMSRAKQNLLMAIVAEDTNIISESLNNTVTFAKQHSALLDEYEKIQIDDTRNEGIDRTRSLIQNVIETRKRIAEMAANPTVENKRRALEIYLNEYEPLLDEIIGIMDDFAEMDKEVSARQSKNVKHINRISWISVIAAAGICSLLTVIVCFALRASVLRPVREIVTAFDEIAAGNMEAVIHYDSRDEMGQMAAKINQTNAMVNRYIHDISDKLSKLAAGDMVFEMDLEYVGAFAAIREAIENTVSSLSRMIDTIHVTADQVGAGAAQVSGGARILAANSSEQAATVEELSVSVAKIADDAENNSDNVKNAAVHVENAYVNVKSCTEQMSRLTKAMAEIDATSSHITNITKVIEDIAFRTNILALNAAIEAARAGTAGKGFAVVADEVRNLASKSAEAAKQTAQLIAASAESVNEGSGILKETAEALKTVEEKTTLINDIINDINRVSANQAAAIDQIKQGLNQVSSVIQSTAATAEENAATSEEMSAQAETLRKEIAKFKVRGEGEAEERFFRTVPDAAEIGEAELVLF